MIEKRIENLKFAAKAFECMPMQELLLQAADTIEALSAKLADMDRPAEDCGGGWIYCEERFPQLTEYSHDNVLQRLEIAYMTDTIGYAIGYFDGYKWIDKRNHEIENVIAWKPFLKLPDNIKRKLE